MGERCTRCAGADRCSSAKLQCGEMNQILYYIAEGRTVELADELEQLRG